MSIHNIDFYEDLTKIIFQISSNMHLISSSEILLFFHCHISHKSFEGRDVKILCAKITNSKCV